MINLMQTKQMSCRTKNKTYLVCPMFKCGVMLVHCGVDVALLVQQHRLVYLWLATGVAAEANEGVWPTINSK